jgi:hypothetical protein
VSPNRTKKLLSVTEEAGYSPAEVEKAQSALALVPGDETDDPLALVQLAQRALEQANTIHEARDVRDYADSVRFLMRRRGLGIQSENEAAVVVFGSERRMGEMLRDMAEAGQRQGRSEPGGKKYPVQLAPGQLAPTLTDLGIADHDRTRWLKLARLTDDQWQYLVDAKRQTGERLSRVDFYRLAEQNAPRQAGNKPPKDHPARDREAEYQAELDRELVLPDKMVGEKPINPWLDPWTRMSAAAEELFDAMSHGWPAASDILPDRASTERVAKVAVAFHRRVEELSK